MTRSDLFPQRRLLCPIAVFFLLALALLFPCRIRAAEPLCQTNGFYFDTVITIALYDTADESILSQCHALMASYESRLSRTLEGSDIWNINHAQGKSVTVSADTAALIQEALSYCALSDGAFDITIAPVVDLWEFHQEKDPVPPSPEALAKALQHVDYHQVQVEGCSVTLTDPLAGIDLGAIAKGYISDGIRDLLVSCGVGSAMINLGGNVMTIGEKPDGSAWNIGIRRPFAENAMDLIQVVPIRDCSVITSGNYERYFVYEGELYHHILSPQTGTSVNNHLTSVSILSPSGTTGDALSTTCFVLGLEDAMELIESLDGIEAMFVTDEEEVIASSGWPVS